MSSILDSQVSPLSPKCLSSFSSSVTTDKPQSLSLHIYQTHDLETEWAENAAAVLLIQLWKKTQAAGLVVLQLQFKICTVF